MKLQPTTRGGRGFTRVELIVVICVIAVVAILLLPALGAAKRKYATIYCVNNLKHIGLVFRIWEGSGSDKSPMRLVMTNDATMKLVSSGNAYLLWLTMSNELNLKFLVCPADQQRTVAASFNEHFSDANISYFFDLDAADAYPQMIFFGDDNLAVNGVRVRPGILNLWTNASLGWTKERHGGAGNIALSDGSVQSITIFGLQQAFQQTGFATNRLVIP